MAATAPTLPDDLFYVWTRDDIDSSFFEDTDEPRPLYVCHLCRDTDGEADLIRGYDPRDGIFERPGVVVEALGGIDLPEPDHRYNPAPSCAKCGGPCTAQDPDDYRQEIERELLEQFEERRESMIARGNN